MKWVSKWDGGKYDIKPAHGTVREWNDGKCWSVYCSNPVIYVNISRTGKWLFGYCHGDYNSYKYHSLYQNDRRNGTWYLAMNGKLIEEKWPA